MLDWLETEDLLELEELLEEELLELELLDDDWLDLLDTDEMLELLEMLELDELLWLEMLEELEDELEEDKQKSAGAVGNGVGYCDRYWLHGPNTMLLELLEELSLIVLPSLRPEGKTDGHSPNRP